MAIPATPKSSTHKKIPKTPKSSAQRASAVVSKHKPMGASAKDHKASSKKRSLDPTTEKQQKKQKKEKSSKPPSMPSKEKQKQGEGKSDTSKKSKAERKKPEPKPVRTSIVDEASTFFGQKTKVKNYQELQKQLAIEHSENGMFHYDTGAESELVPLTK